MHSLYPSGDVTNCPWYLNQAITQALTVLGFMELREDDQPPEDIWLDGEALSAHFERVKASWGSGSSSEPQWEQIEGVEDNELTKGLRGRIGSKPAGRR